MCGETDWCYVFDRGVMPFAQRKKLLERTRSRKKKTKESTASSNSEIVAGSTVSTCWSHDKYVAAALKHNTPLYITLQYNTPQYITP